MTEKESGAVLGATSKVVLEYQGEQIDAIVESMSEGRVRLKFTGAGGATRFQQGWPIRLKYWDSVSLYFVTASVAADSGGAAGHLEVQVSGEPVTLQRRGASRLRVAIPFSFQIVAAESEAIPKGKSFKAETRDISGTGLSFDSVLPLKPTDELELVLQISPKQTINISATVVASERVMRNNRPTNAVRMIFADMSAETRQEIMQVVVRADSTHIE